MSIAVFLWLQMFSIYLTYNTPLKLQSKYPIHRAPGRVNLIGEHVDYCGFPVLPISIKQDVMIAARRDGDTREITITNSDAKFEEFSCHIRKIQVELSG